MYAKISTDPQAIAKRVARNNKRFQKLSPEKQRVAIARDALSQLKAHRLVASQGIYFSAVREEDYETGTVLSSAVCNVCALGALFCGLRDTTCDEPARGIYTSRLKTDLRQHFSEDNLVEIESAFEGGNFAKSATQEERGRRAMLHFAGKNMGPAEKLQAILGNIIRNKGTFKPRKVKELR